MGALGAASADERDSLSERDLSALRDAALQLADCMRKRIAGVMSGGIAVQAKADASLVTTADLEAEKAFRAALHDRFPDHGMIGEEFGAERIDADFIWVVDPVDGTAEFARDVPFWGTITGLFFRGQPVVGVIDHPALNLRSFATYGLGSFQQRLDSSAMTQQPRRLDLREVAAGTANTAARTGTPSRVNYAKRTGHEQVFEALCEAFPNIRVLHTCYTHTLAAQGGLDAAIEWNAPIWDIGASQILVEEAGGSFELVRMYASEDPSVAPDLYCAVFGRRAHVKAISARFERALAEIDASN